MGYDRIKIALTDSCNLDCAHCYMGTKGRSHMEVQNVRRLLAEANELGVCKVDFTGGEPRLHPDFLSIIKAARSYGFHLNISTNGFDMDEHMAVFLNGPDVKLNISLDGVSEKTVRKIRGRSFDEIQHLFRNLQQHGVNFALRFSINCHNWHEVPTMLQYASKLGVDADFEPTQMIGKAESELLLGPEQAEWVKKVMSECLPLSVNIEESFTAPFPCDGAQADLLSIDVSGRAATCLMMGADAASLAGKTSLHGMWTALRQSKQRMAEFCPDISSCGSCAYAHICQSGCWSTAYSMGCFNPYSERR
jgi:radical SAM protein with 4Fe4S-binding SPASM domain